MQPVLLWGTDGRFSTLMICVRDIGIGDVVAYRILLLAISVLLSGCMSPGGTNCLYGYDIRPIQTCVSYEYEDIFTGTGPKTCLWYKHSEQKVCRKVPRSPEEQTVLEGEEGDRKQRPEESSNPLL